MKIGTRSLLFGAHCFFLHPWFVAWAWWKLYGFGRVPVWTTVSLTRMTTSTTSILDPRLWLAFLVHDIGYWGSPNMDGPEGEKHPEAGAVIMGKLFGLEWCAFVLYHSRSTAKVDGVQASALCWPDKLAFSLTPLWLYIPMARLTGEIREYKAVPKHIEETGHTSQLDTWSDDWRWARNLQVQRKKELLNANAE